MTSGRSIVVVKQADPFRLVDPLPASWDTPWWSCKHGGLVALHTQEGMCVCLTMALVFTSTISTSVQL